MNKEVEGRIAVLEIISMTSLGLYLANSRNDPDMSKSIALLGYLRSLIVQRCVDLNLDETARESALHYSDDLLSQALENLNKLRA